MLGVIPKPVALSRLLKFKAIGLSRVQIIEGFGEIKKGDRVKQEKPTPSDSDLSSTLALRRVDFNRSNAIMQKDLIDPQGYGLAVQCQQY